MLSCSFQKGTLTGLVKSMSYVGSDHKVSSITSYTYDPQGRILTAKQTQDIITTVTKYYYFKDSVVSTTPDYDGRIMRNVWILNEKGLAFSNMGIIHTYDQQGYLIRSDFPGLADHPVEKYTISNGDVMAKMNYSAGKLIQTVTYSYYPTADLTRMGMDYIGHSNVHLVKTVSSPYNGKLIISYYTYKFDSKGSVQSMSITDSTKNPNSSYSIEYTYFD
jgi:YD repeat-containing protein